MDLKKLIPESRKLLVMIATLVGYLLHCWFPFLTPDQVYVVLGIVGSWMGVQGLADHGAQGAAIAQKRREKGQGQLDPKAIIAALQDGKLTAEELEMLKEQISVGTELLAQSTATSSEESKPTALTDASSSVEDTEGQGDAEGTEEASTVEEEALTDASEEDEADEEKEESA